MLNTKKKILLRAVCVILLVIPIFPVFAESNESYFHQTASIFADPSGQTVIEGTNFDVLFFLNTNKQSINAFELRIAFDPAKLEIVKPSGGKSISGIWVEPPHYSNTDGTAVFSSIIPNGIVTQSGLLTAITFHAKSVGETTVRISTDSKVLANDGKGTPASLAVSDGIYRIVPKAPAGPRVFSKTHPFQDTWYNNQSPIIVWDADSGTTDYSYALDNAPSTVPDITGEGDAVSKAYENLPDGLWYFHLRARANGQWGGTTHFFLRIDTTPPLEFVPRTEILTAALINRVLVSFGTSDTLSGIDHYEVGVINRAKSPKESPAFVIADSPYQVPTANLTDARVMVRAVDRAGNVRDESLDVKVPPSALALLQNNLILILLVLVMLYLLIHYLFGHHIVRIIVNLRGNKTKIDPPQPDTPAV